MTFVIKLTVTLLFCENKELMRDQIKIGVKKIIQKVRQIYPQICKDNACSNIKFSFGNVQGCFLEARRRRRQAQPVKVQVNAIFENIPAEVKPDQGSDATTLPTEKVLQRAFYNPGNVVKYLSTYGITLPTAPAITSQKVCPPGNVANAAGNDCEPCSAGRYRNENQIKCEPCPVNQYQDQPGQVSCKNCPPFTNTSGANGSTSVDMCRGACHYAAASCQHGGTCRVDGEGRVRCNCPPAYTGPRCESRKEPVNSSIPIIAGTIGGLGGALFIILLVAGIIYCCVDRVKQKTKAKLQRRSTAPSHMNGNEFYDGDYAESQLMSPYAGWTPFPGKERHGNHVNPVYDMQELDYYHPQAGLYESRNSYPDS